MTWEGKQTQFELGKFLHRRYHKLLGDGDYTLNDIQIQTTPEDRCIMSAQCNAAGFFQPINQTWNGAKMDWLPVPIYTVRDQRNCREIIEKGDEYLGSDEIKAILFKYRQLLKFMEIHSGNRVRTVNDVVMFNDALNVERASGLR